MKVLSWIAAFAVFFTSLVMVRLNIANQPPLLGGYTAERAVTDEDLTVFNEAMPPLDGVGYRPVLVSTQVVAGLNYRFTVIASPVVRFPVPSLVHVFIFKPLEGPAELVSIEDFRL